MPLKIRKQLPKRTRDFYIAAIWFIIIGNWRKLSRLIGNVAHVVLCIFLAILIFYYTRSLNESHFNAYLMQFLRANALRQVIWLAFTANINIENSTNACDKNFKLYHWRNDKTFSYKLRIFAEMFGWNIKQHLPIRIRIVFNTLYK